MIVGVGIQCTWGIQRIRIRVDIEVTLHITAHHVHILTQRTRSALLTVTATTDHIQSQVVQNMVRHVQVNRITVHLALLVPSRVNHGWDRTVVVRLGRNTTHADWMVLLKTIREQFVKPVCITELSILKILVAGLLSVGKCKRSSGRIVCVGQFIHLTIHTIVGTIEHTAQA